MPHKDQAVKQTEEQPPEVDFHGAAIIDEDGHEIPITEEMIQKACAELEEGEGSEPDSSQP